MSASQGPEILSAVNLYQLNGLVGLVAGGGRGTTARAFICNGAKVYITGRRLETLNSAVHSLTNGLYEERCLQVDVTEKGSIRNSVKVVEAKGALRILVNNSGQVGPHSSFFSDLPSNSCDQRKVVEIEI